MANKKTFHLAHQDGKFFLFENTPLSIFAFM